MMPKPIEIIVVNGKLRARVEGKILPATRIHIDADAASTFSVNLVIPGSMVAIVKDDE